VLAVVTRCQHKKDKTKQINSSVFAMYVYQGQELRAYKMARRPFGNCTSFEVQSVINILEYLPNAKTVGPQKQPFLSNTRTNNGKVGLCNPLLGSGSVNTLPRRRNDVTPAVLIVSSSEL
jgi:hypothetical protein